MKKGSTAIRSHLLGSSFVLQCLPFTWYGHNNGTDIYFAIEESTIYRWKRWFRNTKEQLNGNLRAVRQAEEGLFYTLLDNTSSLLEEIRKSGGKWLAKAIGITINAGYPAYTQFAYSPLVMCGRLDSS
jgi:hypothetical protein